TRATPKSSLLTRCRNCSICTPRRPARASAPRQPPRPSPRRPKPRRRRPRRKPQPSRRLPRRRRKPDSPPGAPSALPFRWASRTRETERAASEHPKRCMPQWRARSESLLADERVGEGRALFVAPFQITEQLLFEQPADAEDLGGGRGARKAFALSFTRGLRPHLDAHADLVGHAVRHHLDLVAMRLLVEHAALLVARVVPDHRLERPRQ